MEAGTWVGWADHPRSRGVYGLFRALGMQHLGSSPLARGLPHGVIPASRGRRIIPARAGFTHHGAREARAGQDHPRSRGVYIGFRMTPEQVLGSSPLARGLRRLTEDQVAGWGIIPARAGFTASCSAWAPPASDHPRSRGVYTRMWSSVREDRGSSPLARGLPAPLGLRCAGRGIIPARAGFTSRRSPSRRARTDHPRSRGVYWRRPRPPVRRSGSSPLARGLHVVLPSSHVHRRIIPARAGFTPRPPGAAGPSADHPRSRGVYREEHIMSAKTGGSSPLARGLR